jgi:hypothetical protein
MSTPNTTVATTPREVLNPLTGELVDLAAATTTDLAIERDEVRTARDAISTWAKAIDQELTDRLDREAKRSATVGGYKLTVTAPTVRQTDEIGLRAALLKLVDDGVLSDAAVDAAVEVVEVVKARRSGINALHKHANDRVRQVAGDYDQEVPNQSRRVTVNRVTT